MAEIQSRGRGHPVWARCQRPVVRGLCEQVASRFQVSRVTQPAVDLRNWLHYSDMGHQRQSRADKASDWHEANSLIGT